MNDKGARFMVRDALALCLAALATGCMSPVATNFLSGSRKTEVVAESPAPDSPVAPTDGSTAAAIRKDSGAPPASNEQALASVLTELREIRAIDPAAEQQLLADLEQAKPEHYSMIVEAFRTALAYRKQLAERELAEASESHLAATDVEQAATLASHESPPPRRPRPARPEVHTKPDDATPRESEKTSVYERPATQELDPSDDTPPTARVLPSASPLRAPLAADPIVASDHEEGDATPASLAMPAAPVARGQGDWQADLDATIADLTKSVHPQPQSVDELHDHMRLRTLQLLAGREEDAYRPIPGASPAQQDYWSRQLFAMAAYLDGESQLDDKQRAAAALAPLDEARAKLSELATLQIRNLAFAESVDGFGAFKPRKSAPFQPGEQVTLYAEVENFQCTSTEEGYRTSLATSYRVLDQAGQRVEGSQFPEVTDVCRNRRRDFHLQYGIALPKRIYPGPYRLELTITDHASGKIGHATLPFEIAGEQ